MDKRTFLFVIALSLTLFGLNLFFQYYNGQRQQEWQQQQRASQALKEKKLSEEWARRTASPSTLPLTTLFKDSEGHEPLTMGLLIDGQLLTLSWVERLPSIIYAKS